MRARRAFGVTLQRLRAATTSFSIEGAYERKETEAVIHVTYSYSRDHRADLKQWMLALITSEEGVPQFLQPLDGSRQTQVLRLADVHRRVLHLLGPPYERAYLLLT